MRRGVVAILAVAVIGVGLVAVRLIRPPLPAPPPPVFPALQEADPAIELVTVEKPVATVWANVKNAPDLAGNLDVAAGIERSVGKALQRGVSDDLNGVEIIRFEFKAEAVNRFGHDVMANLITLDVPVAELRKARYAALSGGQLLGLASSVKLGAPGAYDAIGAWCMDPARANPALCAKAPH